MGALVGVLLREQYSPLSGSINATCIRGKSDKVLKRFASQFTAQFVDWTLGVGAKSLYLMVGRARFELATNGLKV